MTDTDRLADEIVRLALDYCGRTREGAARAEVALRRIFPEPAPDFRRSVCERCGRPIILVPFGLHFKWITEIQPKYRVWRCDPTPEYPVRSHVPVDIPQKLA